MSRRKLLAVVRLARPQFLAGGLLLHSLGAAIAFYSGAALDWRAFLWGQACVTATQLMTHLANEYFDLAADRANLTPTHWSGGSRVLVAGELPPMFALRSALLCAAVALVAALVLSTVIRPSIWTFILLLSAGLLAWFYSAPPLSLHARGLGELSAALTVPGLTILVGFYLQAGRLEPLPVLVAAPLMCFQFAMLLTIEFPDEAGDRAGGKGTLVVRLGAHRCAWLHNGALALAYAALPGLAALGLPLPAVVGVMYTAPLAALNGWRMGRRAWAQPAQWNSLALWSVVLLIVGIVSQLAVFLALAGGAWR